jgi:hypothetical protein
LLYNEPSFNLIDETKSPYTPLFLIGWRNHFIYTLDKNIPLGTNEGAEKDYKVCHRFMHCSTKNTRVQIAARSGNGHLEVGQTPETVCEGGCPGVEPVVIRLDRNS